MNEQQTPHSAAADGTEPVGAVELKIGTERPASRLRLPAREAGVPVARQFVAGLGDMLHLEPGACEDLKLAVTEACTNAVVHAYPEGGSGPVELEVDVDADNVVLTVRDGGKGPPDLDVLDVEQTGYGLELIGAVSDDVDLREAEGGGTELRMLFHAVLEARLEPLDLLHSPVLRRVVAMVAAHAGFSMDRLSDAVLVAETLAAKSHVHSPNGSVNVVVEDQPRGVVMRVGPLVEGGARGLLDDSRLPAYGGVLEHLADEVEVEPAVNGAGGELLVVLLRAQR